MTFIATDTLLGEVDLSIIDPQGPGIFNPYNGSNTAGRSSFYLEELRGYDPNLGAGVFQYAQFAAGIVQGTVVKFVPTLVGGKVIMTATPWDGAANSAVKLGVAVAAGGAGQWGWFQVDGVAIVNAAAAAANSPAYWQANGVVSSAAVASKQAAGMMFASGLAPTIGQGSATIVLGAAQALAVLCRPEAQGAIT